MARFPGLIQRNGNWTLRVRVPDALRASIGKKEIWKSFGAVSHREAVQLARRARVEVDRLFADHRAPARPAVRQVVGDRNLQHLARAFFRRIEDGAPALPIDPDAFEELRGVNDEDLISLSQGAEDASVQQVARWLAQAEGVELDEASEGFLSLCRLVHRALVEHHARRSDHLAMQPVQERDPLFRDATSTSTKAGKLSLPAAVERYMTAIERRNLAPKSRKLYEARFAVMVELLGAETPVEEVTRQEVRRAIDELVRLPPNARKRYPHLPISEIAEAAAGDGARPMSMSNASIHIRLMSGLFNWLVQEEIVDRNPVSGLRPPGTKAGSRRRPFSIDELNRLFAAAAFSSANGHQWLYWLPRVGLFTGMRLAEISGLRNSDLVEQDGQHFFRVEANQYRGLKVPHNTRMVPVHPVLKSLGILALRDATAPERLLFADLPRSKQDFAHAAQKRMSRAIASALGRREPVFHSLRHNFRDATREAQMPREIAAKLGGWKYGQDQVMDGYGSGHTLRLLSEWLEKIEYPGLTMT